MLLSTLQRVSKGEKMNKTNIEWCDYTLNPITGCRRGCPYCYARRIHNRFHSDVPFETIQFHSGRMTDKELRRKASVIFVGSMSDIEYWEREDTEWILNRCRCYDHHTFMFLSKNPKSYLGFDWPANTMQGLTMTKNDCIGDGYLLTQMCRWPRPFLSIEPLLGMITYHSAFNIMEKIIVGAMTGPGAIKPKPEWIQRIKDCVPAEKIFWKKNIAGY